MWTPTSRALHKQEAQRFASDLTDEEWAVVAPLLPPPSPIGRPARWPMRDFVNAIFYVLRGDVPWRMLPDCFPLRQTVCVWFSGLRDRGLSERVNHHFVMLGRKRVGREASPSAAVIDSQSTKTTEAGGSRGYDAGKKILGRKRHAMIDTDGRPLVLQCHATSVQDCDGAIPLLQASRARFPFVEKALADAGSVARCVADATRIAIEIVCEPKEQIGLAVHPRRWVVERCFAWLGRNRRLAEDFEATITSATAFLFLAPVLLLIRRIARST